MSDPCSVLIVEDEPLIAMMLEDFLDSLGHTVVATCDSVDTALAQVEEGGFDVAIIDVIWNGFLESIKIAAMAEAYEVNVAPHNYYGHLCSAVSAHFCAVVPNFRVMEIDIDSVSWRDELFINAPVIENGDLILPTGPGWGVEVNEKAVRAHPPKA